MKTTLNMNTISEMVKSGNRSFIGCYVPASEIGWFYTGPKPNTLETGDWIEGEGASELVIKNTGQIIGYFGRYNVIS